MTSSSYSTQVQFSRAISVVNSLPRDTVLQPNVNDKLGLYGLYKQAVEGDCHRARPSSKLTVQYAKWKAWNQLRQMSPVEAQLQYVRLLLDILLELVERYPQHEFSGLLYDSIHYIRMDTDIIPLKMEKREKGFLQDIEQDELADNISPTEQRHLHQFQYSYSSNSTSTGGYTCPVTPITSPPSIQQQKQKWNNPNRHDPRQRHYDLKDAFSDADTVDREVATATHGLGLISPEQHPYSSYRMNDLHEQNGPRSSSPSSSEKALESLQTEVAALTEQLNHLRETVVKKNELRMQWSWLRFGKFLLKHTSIQLLLMFLIFLVLLRRKSPIAYAILGYVGSNLQNLLSYFREKLVFWKLTV